MWSKNSLTEIKELIETVNSKLKSAQVVSATEIFKDEKLYTDDVNVYYFESEIPKELFDAAVHNYKGQIKVDQGGMQSILSIIEDPHLVAPTYTSVKGKVVGSFTLPCKYNPVSYISGFLSTVKRAGFDFVTASTKFDCSMILRNSRATCKNCGKESAYISLTSGNTLPLGRECVTKSYPYPSVKECLK